MSNHQPELLVEDIIESGNKILFYTEGLSFEQFTGDSKTVDAVIRNFEIIGEAANRLTEDFKDKNTNIDWHRIKGFRNRIVHDYMGIDYTIVWEIRNTFLPQLLKDIQKVQF